MVAPIQPGYCFSNQSKAKLRKILGKYKLCLSTYKAVFSPPYGGQRHKAAAGIPNGSAKSPVLSFPSGETKKQLFKGVLGSPAVNSSSHSKTWQCLKILCTAKPPRSVTLHLTAVKKAVNKMMSTIFVPFHSYLHIFKFVLKSKTKQNKHALLINRSICVDKELNHDQRENQVVPPGRVQWDSGQGKTSQREKHGDPDPGGPHSAYQLGWNNEEIEIEIHSIV